MHTSRASISFAARSGTMLAHGQAPFMREAPIRRRAMTDARPDHPEGTITTDFFRQRLAKPRGAWRFGPRGVDQGGGGGMLRLTPEEERSSRI